MEYIRLSEVFSKTRCHAGRNPLTEMFEQILVTVDAFVMKKDGNDAK
jgi:hypothetical protein